MPSYSDCERCNLGYIDFGAAFVCTGIRCQKDATALALNKVLELMKERDRDNSAMQPNMADKGYHLAIEHLEQEIEKIKKCNDKIPEGQTSDVDEHNKPEKSDVIWISC